MKRSGHFFTTFLCILFSLCLILTSCSIGQNHKVSSTSAESRRFTEFTDSIFKSNVASDALSLNYTLAKPEQFGISSSSGGFCPLSYQAMKNASSESENLLYSLKQFDQANLSQTQQVLYDSLAYTLKMNQKNSEYALFTRPLSPVTGLQAQLPILLAEYRFNSIEDVQNYFHLLESIPPYFDSILSFMEIQASEHMLPCKNTLEEIMRQCLAFIEQNGSKILLRSFRSRIRQCSFVDTASRKQYIAKNKELVRSRVLPAYRHLVQGITTLSPLAQTEGSLSSYKNGKEYYKHLFASETGSSTSVEDTYHFLFKRLKRSKETLLAYAKKDPSLFRGLVVRTSSSPKELLDCLAKAITADFPPTAKVNVHVSPVDSSLEDFLSPAFYLTPPLDAFEENVIYINNSSRFAGSDLSTTLAHEGYPGHLYQNVYHRQQNHPLLSYLLNFNGYTEGWATYAEIYSYKYLGYSRDEIGILRNHMIVSLCIYGICDIGIHYYGWNEEKIRSFLSGTGNFSSHAASDLYNNIINEPGSYLKYTVGYMEFAKLKDAAKTRFGKQYSEKAFHKYVLSIGPAPFDVLMKYMKNS